MVLLSSGPTPDTTGSGTTLSEAVRQVFLTGAALTIPLLITVIILAFVVNFILQAISPVVVFLDDTYGIGSNVSPLAMELLAVLTLVALIFVVGLVAEARSGSGFERVFDTLMARIPGIGSVYTSFNEMTELLLSNDADSFREVKLVEFPTDGSYSLAFVTADSPPTIAETTGHDDVTTLFMPLAPNPVMGGYVIHVSSDRVYDIDLTVEQGIRSIVTSGVATGDRGDDEPSDELVDLETIREQARDGVGDLSAWGTRTVDDLSELTGDAAEDLRAQARREFAALHPDIDESEIDEEEAVRHYMLEQSSAASERPADGDGEPTDGAPAEVDGEPADETPSDGDTTVDGPGGGDA
ncbi:hypothetical protein C475_14198 [Halosimplex carlsbadense 2-9-1]|uniref:DUF502 domain-containing protein n=1 Tax=Halosimplex carlsbadense 2-9-1 TaxID=797114 RepID=M0CPF8_9EURY|nr:DUF502 domain-containing protein [Halosimplex carlsbadense]ELZ23769.1 hypothetical protein C475_14198 [Halosimplex carlsbadense 2-9-1]